jgi:hypothetical protein
MQQDQSQQLDLTRLLLESKKGDAQAIEALFPLV